MSTQKTYTTENGTVLRLKTVRIPLITARMRTIEAEYRLQHPELNVPTYKAKLVGGEVYDLPLEEKGLDDPTDPIQTKVNRVKWARHQAALAEWEAIQTEQEHLTWLMLGVEVDLPEGWETEVEALGINLPQDPLQRKALWLHYFALAPADFQLLRAELQMLAVGDVIAPNQVESFRRGIRGALEDEARARFDDALASFAQRPLVGGAATERVGDGESVGEDSEPVGPAEPGR
jgi:hypothetical protein